MTLYKNTSLITFLINVCATSNILIILYYFAITETLNFVSDSCFIQKLWPRIVLSSIFLWLPSIFDHSEKKKWLMFVLSLYATICWFFLLLDLALMQRILLHVESVFMSPVDLWNNSVGMRSELVISFFFLTILAYILTKIIPIVISYCANSKNRGIFVLLSIIFLFFPILGGFVVCESVQLFKNEKMTFHPVKQRYPLKQLFKKSPRFVGDNNLSILIFILDGIPMREFSAHIPEKSKRTSERFRKYVDLKFEKCILLKQHFAVSSYTHDAMYALLHGIHPLIYSGQDRLNSSSYPVLELRKSGYSTGIFHNGDIGRDSCNGKSLKDKGGTLSFDKTMNLESDTAVIESAVQWVGLQKSKIFLVVYLQSTHLMYATSDFERVLNKGFEDVEIVTKAAARFSPLTFITTDHGDAIAGVDGDCGKKCSLHGYGVHGHHATQQVSHIPIWICPHDGNISSEFLRKASKKTLTSSVDLMPTILDLLQVASDVPINKWSSGKSWLDGINYSYVYSWSNLLCIRSIAVITGQGAFYFQQDQNIMSKFRYLKYSKFQFPVGNNSIANMDDTMISSLVSAINDDVIGPILERSQNQNGEENISYVEL